MFRPATHKTKDNNKTPFEAFDWALRTYFAQQNNKNRKDLINAALVCISAAKTADYDSNEASSKKLRLQMEMWRNELKFPKEVPPLFSSKSKSQAFENLMTDLEYKNPDVYHVLDRAKEVFKIADNATLSDPEDRICSEIFALRLQEESLRKRGYEDAAREVRSFVGQAQQLTNEYMIQKSSPRWFDKPAEDFRAYRINLKSAIDTTLKSDHLKNHRGVKKALSNVLLCLSIGGLFYLKATAKKRGSFWLHPDTESVAKLKKIDEGFVPKKTQQKKHPR